MQTPEICTHINPRFIWVQFVFLETVISSSIHPTSHRAKDMNWQKGATTGIVLFLLVLDKIADWFGRVVGMIADTPTAMENLQRWGIDDPQELIKWSIGGLVIILIWLPWKKWLGLRDSRRAKPPSPVANEKSLMHLLVACMRTYARSWNDKAGLKVIEREFEHAIPNYISNLYGAKEAEKYLEAIKKCTDKHAIPSAAYGYISGFVDKKVTKAEKELFNLSKQVEKLEANTAIIQKYQKALDEMVKSLKEGKKLPELPPPYVPGESLNAPTPVQE